MNGDLRRYARRLAVHLRPHRPKVALLALLLLGNVAFQLVNPLILRRFIDAVATPTPSARLTSIAAAFIAVAVVTQVVGVLETYVAEDLGWTTTNRLRVDLTQHCLGLDMGFHNAHLPGEMIERIDGDVALLANFSRASCSRCSQASSCSSESWPC